MRAKTNGSHFGARQEQNLVKGKVIGIDLGTTYSSAAHINNEGLPEVIRNAEGDLQTPSVILFPDGVTPIVGKLALNQMMLYPPAITRFKRTMGKVGPDGKPLEVYRDKNDKVHTAIDFSAFVLSKIKTDSENTLGISVPYAVISTPHYFSDTQRQATEQAGTIARFKVLRIVSEPVCAAYAYNINLPSDKKLIVFDFGGGTLDISVIEKQGDDLFVITSEGDTNLGGEDLTGKLTVLVEEKFNKLGVKFDRNSIEDLRCLQIVRDRCEQGKKILSVKPQHIFVFNAKGQEVSFSFTQGDIANLGKELFDGAEQLTIKVLDEIKCVPDMILLVGGSSRIPEFKTRVKKILKKEPLEEGIVDVDLAVSLGAAVYAEAEMAKLEGKTVTIAGKRVPTIHDVITHSIGVSAFFANDSVERNSVILPKNTEVGTSKTEYFALKDPSSNTALIRILEGEDKAEADQCKELFRIELRNLPHEPVPSQRIEVRLEITDSGILRCWARDLVGGKDEFHEIKHSTGLTEDEVKQKREELKKLKKEVTTNV